MNWKAQLPQSFAKYIKIIWYVHAIKTEGIKL